MDKLTYISKTFPKLPAAQHEADNTKGLASSLTKLPEEILVDIFERAHLSPLTQLKLHDSAQKLPDNKKVADALRNNALWVRFSPMSAITSNEDTPLIDAYRERLGPQNRLYHQLTSLLYDLKLSNGRFRPGANRFPEWCAQPAFFRELFPHALKTDWCEEPLCNFGAGLVAYIAHTWHDDFDLNLAACFGDHRAYDLLTDTHLRCEPAMGQVALKDKYAKTPSDRWTPLFSPDEILRLYENAKTHRYFAAEQYLDDSLWACFLQTKDHLEANGRTFFQVYCDKRSQRAQNRAEIIESLFCAYRFERAHNYVRARLVLEGCEGAKRINLPAPTYQRDATGEFSEDAEVQMLYRAYLGHRRNEVQSSTNLADEAHMLHCASLMQNETGHALDNVAPALDFMTDFADIVWHKELKGNYLQVWLHLTRIIAKSRKQKQANAA